MPPGLWRRWHLVAWVAWGLVLACGQPPVPLPEGYRGASAADKLRLLDAAARDRVQDPVPLLIRLAAEEPEPVVREQVIDRLGHLKDNRAFAVLAAATAPTEPQEIRLAALDALSSFSDPRVAGVLREHLADPDVAIRETASAALDYFEAEPLAGPLPSLRSPTGKE